jgi:integrase
MKYIFFLEELTGGLSKATRRLRYSQLKTFFNFIIDQLDLNIKNPCSSAMLSKSFKAPAQTSRKILEKETVDEMIYNAKSIRDRLILELQARCGLRIGELLKLKLSLLKLYLSFSALTVYRLFETLLLLGNQSDNINLAVSETAKDNVFFPLFKP